MNFPKDELTFALGFLGAVLGVINLWRALDRDRVKLRVTPLIAYLVGDIDERPRLCIEIVNLSVFPVTVKEVGFTVWCSNYKLVCVNTILSDKKLWPCKLDSRESVTVYFDPSLPQEQHFQQIRRAYAKTECGETRYGKSKALSEYIAYSVKV